jgi:hypothetical protein
MNPLRNLTIKVKEHRKDVRKECNGSIFLLSIRIRIAAV